ncbi:unnamed protein product [Trifolium pratense]|uniref:Uncharacterized protein n=1 Tax=Trifolium pratense TaxID=57577 RepID=A0ACB0IW06_TRIPR|nr:unnamed protein product [Trifolium pratense]
MILNRENVTNHVVMVQPSLISYSFHSGPEPDLLDVAAIAADRVLLLYSFFTVAIFHGSTIANGARLDIIMNQNIRSSELIPMEHLDDEET